MDTPSEESPPHLTYEFVRLPDRRYSFSGELVHFDEELIAIASPAKPSKPLMVGGEEVLGEGYPVLWFLFNGQPWDIGKVYRPDGTLTGYYADALETVRWKGADPTTLEPLVDLFLDLWVGEDGTIVVLDEDELEAAIEAGSITAPQVAHARAVIAALEVEARAGRFPPDPARQYVLNQSNGRFQRLADDSRV